MQKQYCDADPFNYCCKRANRANTVGVGMRTITRNVAIIAGVMGVVMGVTTSESGTGNRRLSPLSVSIVAFDAPFDAAFDALNFVH